MSHVAQLLELNDSCGCVGNSDEEFLSLPSIKKGIMKDITGMINVLNYSIDLTILLVL